MIKLAEVLKLLLIVSCVFSASENGEKRELSEHFIAKDRLFKWIKENNDTDTLYCHTNTDDIYEDTFLKTMIAPMIKSYPCGKNNESPYYQYRGGFIQNGQLNGKGKLFFMSEKEWIRLPKEKRYEVQKQKVCFMTNNVWLKPIKEIIGYFKDGKLHGKARITYYDKSYSLGIYRNGRAHGHHRLFDPKGNLVESGIYEKGWPKGYHWRLEYDHLVYIDRTIVQDYVKPTLVFPILNNGSLGDPMAGDYFPYSGALENIHDIKLKPLTFTKLLYCNLEIAYEVLKRQPYRYSVHSRRKFSESKHDHTLLCDIIPRNERAKANAVLRNWFKKIDEILKPEKLGIVSYSNSIKANEILWRLAPLEVEPNLEISRQLISNIQLNVKNKNTTAKIFGGSTVRVHISGNTIALNRNNIPNGLNDIRIDKEHQKLILADKTFNWSPTRITGIFKNGVLNGLTRIETNTSTTIWGIVRKGILHGPVLTNGITYLLEPVSTLKV